MDKINLQDKTVAEKGVIESYWFENPHVGLENTQFHRVSIPLLAFDSGLEYEEQPLETSIEFDWYKLNLSNPSDLNGIDMNHLTYVDAEASVYVGAAHNRCHVTKLLLKSIAEDQYQISGELIIEFENEGVAENEPFVFSTTAVYKNA